MPFFSKKIKTKPSFSASQLNFGHQNTASLAAAGSLPRLSRQEGDGSLIDELLELNDHQKNEITELKNLLRRSESMLEDCLARLNVPTHDTEFESRKRLRQKSEEMAQLRIALERKDAILRDQINSLEVDLCKAIQEGRDDLKRAHLNFEAKLMVYQNNSAEERQHLEQKFSKQRDSYVLKTREIQLQLVEERKESERRRDGLQEKVDELARVKRTFEHWSNSQAQKVENLETEIRRKEKHIQEARDIIQTHTETIQMREQRVYELEAEVQTQTETVGQTKLILNRTRNELVEEKRKGRLVREECEVKNQQLEFVQQQCAIMEEQQRNEGLENLELEERANDAQSSSKVSVGDTAYRVTPIRETPESVRCAPQ